MAIIKIFNENETDFKTNGNIVINPIKCREYKKKSLNGWYIEVEVNVKYKKYIEQDKLCVVKTKSKINPQAFRIGNPETENNIVKFTAEHVMFDSRKYFLVDVRPTNQNGQNALSNINERTDKKSPFNIFSDVPTQSTAYFIRKNLLEAWSVIEERWGGVFDADNWNISFLKKVGNDNGETITYGKNMQGIRIIEDWSNVCTRIYPVGPDELMLEEKFIDSDIQYNTPYTKTETFTSDLEEKEEESEEEKKQRQIKELRENAQKYLEENKYPKVSYEVISNINQNMEIGDTIHVKHPLVNLLTEVLEYEHNILTNKVEILTFGNFTRNVKSKFDGIKESIKNATEQFMENITRQDIVIKQQTDLINSMNKNGIVYIDENEILILDKVPKETAKNVWRFGLAGLGFSSNGYEGPFETAITMDGQINAKFITTGTMSTARIEGLENTLNDYLVHIELNSDNIQQLVATQNSIIEKFGNYITTTDMQTLITQSAESVTATVNKSISTAKQEAINSSNSSTDSKLRSYSTTTEMNAAIKLQADTITSQVNKKVNSDDFGTLIEQNYSHVKVAWNNISKYIQFENGELRIYDSASTSSQKLRSVFNYNGEHFYRDDYYVGKIGANSWKGNSSHKSLEFDLEYEGKFMTFARKESSSATEYGAVFTYSRANSIYNEEGLHLGTNLYTHNWNIYPGNDKTVRISNNAFIDATHEQTIMQFRDTGILDIYDDIDMHNWGIKNAGNIITSDNINYQNLKGGTDYYIEVGTKNNGAFGITLWQSDGRLKKNIITSNIRALDTIKQIKHRQFDWKENGKHQEVGYITEEMKEINEDFVIEINQENGEKISQINETKIIPYLSKAIQEQQEEIEEQKKLINKLLQTAGLLKESDMTNSLEPSIEEPQEKPIDYGNLTPPVQKNKEKESLPASSEDGLVVTFEEV